MTYLCRSARIRHVYFCVTRFSQKKPFLSSYLQEILFPEYKIHTRAIHRVGTQPRNTKKRMKHKIHCLLLFCILPIPANAAWQMPVTNYYPKEYAAGTQNWQLKQQRNGWIYAANNYGLLEFDGESWQLYGIWNSSVIRSVEIDSDGNIYVGGANEFGKLTANRYGGLDYQPLSLDIPEVYKNFGEVWNLHRQEDILYIQTRDHIFIRPDQGELTVITPKSRIYCSALIGNGIYVATVDGIYLLTGNHLNALRGSEQLSGYEIRSLQPYGENGVLIGTDFNGIFLYDGEKIGRFQTEAENFIRKNQLYTLSVGKKYIAYGTVLNGLAITDMQGKNCRYVNTQNGLQNNTILSLLFDRDENLWLGLDQGLDKIVIESPLSLLYGQLFSYGSGYTSAIYENKIYFGTNQGLYYCNYPLDISQQHTELQLVEGSGGQVWSLDEIDGTLFCSHNRGLFIVDKMRLQKIDNSEGFWQVRPLPETDYAIAGSYNGLYILHKQQGKYSISHKIKGFDITSRNFEIDAQGKIWIVSNRGIERLTLSEDKMTCVSGLIHAQEKQNDYFHIDKIDEEIILSNNHFCGIVNANGILEERKEFFDLLDGMGLVDKGVAALLFGGIVADSGCFQYPSTTARTHEIARELMGYGIDAADIIYRVHRRLTPPVFALKTRVLSNCRFFDGGKIALLTFTKKDFEETGTSPSDTEGMIASAIDVDGVEVAFAVSEAAEKSFKVSIRTKDSADACDIASAFGGGGHSRAAGCRMNGFYEDVVDKLLKAARDRM